MPPVAFCSFWQAKSKSRTSAVELRRQHIWSTTVSVSLYAWLRDSLWCHCHSHASGIWQQCNTRRCIMHAWTLHTLVWDSPNAMLFALNNIMSCQILLKWSLQNEQKKLDEKQSLLRKLWLVCTNFTVKVYGEGLLCLIPKHFCKVCIYLWMTESECMKKYITALFEPLSSIRRKLASVAVSQILILELACERYWHLLLSRIANMPKRLNLLCRYHLRREVSNMRNCISEKGLYSLFVQGWRVCMFGLNLLK